MRLILTTCLAVLLVGCGFDRARWAAGHEDGSERDSMICDAVAAGVVPGAQKETVRSLLGPPADGPPDEEPSRIDIYELGVDMSLDTHLLSIAYDGNGAVSEVRITYDWGSRVLRPQSPGDCGGNWTFKRES